MARSWAARSSRTASIRDRYDTGTVIMGQTPEQYERFNARALAWFTDVFGDPDTVDWARIRRQFAEARRDYLRGRADLTGAEGRELAALDEGLDDSRY